jgi:DNA-directed RNA polymerase subunit omega
MARVTVEDCLREVDNRFSLVHLAAKRVRQLREGALPQMESKNKEIVLSLREIASGHVYPVSAEKAALERAEARERERERLSAAAAAAAKEEGAPADGDSAAEPVKGAE